MKHGKKKSKTILGIIFTIISVLFLVIKIGELIDNSTNSEQKRQEILLKRENSKNLKKLKNSITNDLSKKKLSDTVISIQKNITIKLPKGFYIFPKYQDEKTPLILYMGGYLLTVEKLKSKQNFSAAQQWIQAQGANRSLFPIFPYKSAKLVKNKNQKKENNVYNSNFDYSHVYGTRYGYIEMIEIDNYRYFITFSGFKRDYDAHKKYLNYYLSYE